MKTLISSVILLAAAVGPAHAQIYKWVDAAGKTHYSDTAPMDGKKPGTVTDRISVYAPDPALLARAAATPGPDPVLSDKVDRLERQLHAERLARPQQQVELASLTQASQSIYERCVSERRVDCDAYGGSMPYVGPIAVVPVRHRRPIRVRTSFTALSAGNVVGPGIMPGTFNGPNAITAGNFTFR
ncbi:MAG TPA: DUF4124 domain-containing protein [Burkholderiales bacterium]|nr:DUF4124 domain-containing protein [Burkholderiales bacterium]